MLNSKIFNQVQKGKKLVISFSGGETSAMLTNEILIQCSDFRQNIKVVFCNTGQENEETLEFVNNCDINLGFQTEWIEAVINSVHNKGTRAKKITFETASRNGEPFEAMISKHGIPNMTFPHCTRELKKQPFRAYLKSEGWKDYYTCIGIRADEFDRASNTAKKEQIIYPMIDAKITKLDVNSYWNKQPFRLNLKGYQGNCKWCWKKSYKKLSTIASENPEAFLFPAKMEQKYSNYRPESQPNRTLPALFFRGNHTVEDIFQMKNLEKAFDDSVIYADPNAPTQLEIDFVNNSGCNESCEAFS